eukprot:9470761-Pyramimonas_sp.AAC.1
MGGWRVHKEAEGRTYRFFLSQALASRAGAPMILGDAILPTHSPVAIPYPVRWVPVMKAIEDVDGQDSLQHAWDMALMAVEQELCARYDKVGVGYESYLGREGPAQTKHVKAHWNPRHVRLQHGPRLRAWLQAARWAKHLVKARAFRCKMAEAFKFEGRSAG